MHVMIDIETMGTSQSAVITSIGAAKFCFRRQEILGEFYERVEWMNGQEGRTLDPGTVHWWMSQSEEALAEMRKNGKPLRKVLEQLKDFIPSGAGIWGNGPCFDMSILENAYLQEELGVPWKFWDVRCYRTIRMLVTGLAEELPREGTHHNALDDSIHQAKNAMVWAQALRAKEEDL